MHLSALAQFTVTERRPGPGADVTHLVGVFATTVGVRDRRGWLYRGERASIIADLVDDASIEAGQPITLSVFTEDLSSDVQPGAVFTWLDGYWQPYHLAMVLAPPERWERRSFVAAPARYFSLEGVTGWQPVDAPLPPGAVDLGVRDGAWNHEHCELCNASIGDASVAEGFVDAHGRWLCHSCHARHALRHDVSFAAEV